MSGRRLRFFPDYYADPVWAVGGGGMVNLDDLPVSDEARSVARRWNRRWEQLALKQQEAEAFVDGMSSRRVEPVADEEWASLESDGRAVWQRLRGELGSEWSLEWDYP
jgi:hypothetical protein